MSFHRGTKSRAPGLTCPSAWSNMRHEAKSHSPSLRHQDESTAAVSIKTQIPQVSQIYYIPRIMLCLCHYNDTVMGAMASQITGVSIVSSTVRSGTHQRKYQRPASLAFVRGIHQWPVDSPHKRPVTQKIFPFDDVIMFTRIFQCYLTGTGATVCLTQIAKFMGPSRGPPGSCRPQMGPMLAPWTLLSGEWQWTMLWINYPYFINQGLFRRCKIARNRLSCENFTT